MVPAKQPRKFGTKHIVAIIVALILTAGYIIAALIGGGRSSQQITTSTPTPTSSPTPPSPPTLVQMRPVQSGSALVIQSTFSSPVTAGNLIIVAITQWEGTVITPTDTRGDTYIQVTAPQHANPSNDFVELYYAKNAMGGATTVTVHFSTAGNSSASNDMNVGIYEYSGLDTTHPVDHVVYNTGNTNTPNGGTLFSTTGNELYFVVGVDDNGNNSAPSVGSGYTLEDHQDDSNMERFYTEDRIAAPGHSQTNFSIAAQSYWAVIGVSFKSA